MYRVSRTTACRAKSSGEPNAHGGRLAFHSVTATAVGFAEGVVEAAAGFCLTRLCCNDGVLVTLARRFASGLFSSNENGSLATFVGWRFGFFFKMVLVGTENGRTVA